MSDNERQEEERRQLRPYRRFVQAIFALIGIALAAFLLRGIIRHLDRMPSVESFQRLESVDERALRACADDLLKLETQIRIVAGKRLPAVRREVTTPTAWEDLERRRLEIVARCHLDAQRDDAAAAELAAGADALEQFIRGFSLLEARFEKEVATHGEDARRRLRNISAAAKQR